MYRPPFRAVAIGVLGSLVVAALVWTVLAFGHRQQAEADRIRAEALAFAHEAAEQQAARERASEEQAARKQAAEERAARRQAAREQAAREKAARERAAEQQADGQALQDQAADEQAAASVARHVVTGEMTVPDINGALVTQVGGYPGQPLSEFSMAQLNKMQRLIDSLTHGKTYPCPLGSGGGYSDVAAGGQVTVQDGEGTILATTTLAGGILNSRGCTFSFSTEVPDADFYQVTITHRGALTYSRTDLEANGWKVLAHL